MPDLLLELATLDCQAASCALAAGSLNQGVRLLARAALILRVRNAALARPELPGAAQVSRPS
jgi:hypothetical protein